ncbi:pyridine nucleotide-disulfide oxidoreductase [Actinomyces sp. oral taxon 848 str. F0332]|nr:pyridine nucleotide-disulfide oxidoreductase [Actinomyces sp. oral taxon 848 str. F0332]
MASAPEKYDLVVVGGGKAGKSLAMLRAKTGDKVFMVERDKIGGTCINVACIPTKTLVSSARRLVEVRTAASYGVDLPGADLASARVDLQALRARKESVVGGMVEAHKRMFAAPGLDFVLGTAKFVGPKTVEATLADGSVRVVEGERVLINTGTTPAIPPIEGLGDVAYWTSEDALRLTEIPDRLVILGGGVIGVEMASMMAAFGANVTLIEGGEHILAREDADVAEEMAANLAAQGVTVRTGERAMRVSSDGEGVVVHTTAGEVAGTRLLVALGRAPVTKGLGLEAAGVELTERGFVKVDSRLETTAPGVYAAGDVAGTPQFTHASWNDFRVLRDLFAGKEASTEGRLIPWAVFATPELGRVGMSESEARAAGRDIRVAKVAAAAVPRAKTHGHVEGFYKVVVDVETEEILGAAIVAESASEVIAAVQTAMLGGLPWPKLRDAVIAHPTMAEGLNIVLDSLG